MNFDFIGLSSILFVTLIVYQIAKLNPSIKLILYVALVVRILFIFINENIFVLPMDLVTQIDLNLRLMSGQMGFFKCSRKFSRF